MLLNQMSILPIEARFLSDCVIYWNYIIFQYTNKHEKIAQGILQPIQKKQSIVKLFDEQPLDIPVIDKINWFDGNQRREENFL